MGNNNFFLSFPLKKLKMLTAICYRVILCIYNIHNITHKRFVEVANESDRSKGAL